MPIIEVSNYVNRPKRLFNGHLQTIYPSLYRHIEDVNYSRERLELADGDFLDLDWCREGKERLVIVSHGLEGNSERHYCKGMVKTFIKNDWDALAWNCRTCSGEMNRLPRMYHHGVWDDLDLVINHVLAQQVYKEIVLVGFSMGGSIVMNYLAKKADDMPEKVKCGVAISVPFNLPSTIPGMHKWNNAFYRKRFLRKLGRKIKAKSEQFPELFNYAKFEGITTFYEFDNTYTAPLHHFDDAQDFYNKVSPHQSAEKISTPLLILNASNDPMLSKACYPKTLAANHKFIFLEIPRHGGHVGFLQKNKESSYADERALEFANIDFSNS